MHPSPVEGVDDGDAGLERDGVIHVPSRKEVAEWTASVYWNLVGSKILKNVWRKTGFNWFEGIGNDNNDDHANSNGDGNDDYNDDNDGNADINFVFDDSKGDEEDIDEDVAEEGWDIVDEGGGIITIYWFATMTTMG
jgi:hypothetical protein